MAIVASGIAAFSLLLLISAGFEVGLATSKGHAILLWLCITVL